MTLLGIIIVIELISFIATVGCWADCNEDSKYEIIHKNIFYIISSYYNTFEKCMDDPTTIRLRFDCTVFFSYKDYRFALRYHVWEGPIYFIWVVTDTIYKHIWINQIKKSNFNAMIKQCEYDINKKR